MDTRKRIIEMLGDRADLAIVNRHNLLIPLQLTDRGDDRRCTAAEGLLELARICCLSNLFDGEPALADLVALLFQQLNAGHTRYARQNAAL